jgi:2-polyprenyl-6-methoxyphenol hydroxylase-like FAD-dependent oxidoreductase
MTTHGGIAVIGAGPAGSIAALAALGEGSAVTIAEKSAFPRHKVCGEFLSPEVAPLLESLDLGSLFTAARPARITRAVLHFGGREKRFRLPEPAFGLSRCTLDQLLLGEAVRRGARLDIRRSSLGTAIDGAETRPLGADPRCVIAHGRRSEHGASQRRGQRLFGFKAHYRDPSGGTPDDTVALYFCDGGYIGVSPVECGAINVCGLAPEAALRACEFRPEALFPEALCARLSGLERSFDWLQTGPLEFHAEFNSRPDAYLAGDALGFVDPFTGTGILAAMLTGRFAGQAASRRLSFDQHYAECRRILRRQYRVASALRSLLGAGLSERVARWIPGRMLYHFTRPTL